MKPILIVLAGLAFIGCSDTSNQPNDVERQAWFSLPAAERREMCENYNLFGAEIIRAVAEREAPEFADAFLNILEEFC